MVFVGLEAGSKIDDFSEFPGGAPELRERTSRREGNGRVPGGSRRPFTVSHDSFQHDFRHQV